MATARRLCPEGIFLSPRLSRYREISDQVMEIFRRYTPLVEPLSLDEAFLDVTGSIKLFGPAPEIAVRIKKEIQAETGLTASAGVATQKHIAKIASGFQKPDGLTVAPAGTERDFLWPLPLSRLWGVGSVTLKTLEALNLKTIGDLAKTPIERLKAKLGNSGQKLWLLANCVDDRQVEPEREAKSIGHEETYPIDIDGEESVNRELLALSVKVAKRLRDNQLKGRTLTIKVRGANFSTWTRSRTVSKGLDDHLEIYRLAKALFPWEKKGPYRLLGVTASHFSEESDRGLFDGDLFGPPEPAANSQLLKAMDRINERFGEAGLKPASLLDKSGRKK
jgi:DNA polymerase-4